MERVFADSNSSLLPLESLFLKGLVVAGVVMSAIVVKESTLPPPALIETRTVSNDSLTRIAPTFQEPAPLVVSPLRIPEQLPQRTHADSTLRWFDGRPIKPDRVVWMRVTAYSPHEASCGHSADGRTATMHCVTTNASQLVAADPKVLPYGSLLKVPGYANELVVPVLDCGGAIKGDRLDVLFPTHAEAMKWGVRMLPVTIYRYADGEPMADPRTRR